MRNNRMRAKRDHSKIIPFKKTGHSIGRIHLDDEKFDPNKEDFEKSEWVQGKSANQSVINAKLSDIIATEVKEKKRRRRRVQPTVEEVAARESKEGGIKIGGRKQLVIEEVMLGGEGEKDASGLNGRDAIDIGSVMGPQDNTFMRPGRFRREQISPACFAIPIDSFDMKQEITEKTKKEKSKKLVFFTSGKLEEEKQKYEYEYFYEEDEIEQEIIVPEQGAQNPGEDDDDEEYFYVYEEEDEEEESYDEEGEKNETNNRNREEDKKEGNISEDKKEEKEESNFDQKEEKEKQNRGDQTLNNKEEKKSTLSFDFDALTFHNKGPRNRPNIANKDSDSRPVPEQKPMDTLGKKTKKAQPPPPPT